MERARRKLRLFMANIIRFCLNSYLDFCRRYPPIEQDVLLWAFHLSWTRFAVCYVENPFTINNSLRLLFTLCYLRGFFAFEQDAEQMGGLSQNQLSFFIIILVLILNIRSPNSLIKVPTAIVFWSCLLFFFSPANFVEFSFSTVLRITLVAFVLRPILLFGIHCLAHGFLRKKMSSQTFRKKLFYLCPNLEEPEYSRVKLPGEKSIFWALTYLTFFLLWSLTVTFFSLL